MGLVIIIGALIGGARLLHVPTHWIVFGWILLVGQGVLIRGVATRQRNLDIDLRHGKDLLSIRPRRPNVDMNGEGPTAIPQKAGAEGSSRNGLTSA
jgi:uncharacterized membrane protein YfcA